MRNSVTPSTTSSPVRPVTIHAGHRPARRPQAWRAARRPAGSPPGPAPASTSWAKACRLRSPGWDARPPRMHDHPCAPASDTSDEKPTPAPGTSREEPTGQLRTHSFCQFSLGLATGDRLASKLARSVRHRSLSACLIGVANFGDGASCRDGPPLASSPRPAYWPGLTGPGQPAGQVVATWPDQLRPDSFGDVRVRVHAKQIHYITFISLLLSSLHDEMK